jgi:Flp pilus assembly protein TadD
MTIEEAFNLAGEKRREGKVGEAEGIYRQILAQRPSHCETRMNLGTMLHECGRFADAVLVYRLGLALDPSSAVIWSNLGNTLIEMDEIAQSAAACRQAVALDPQLSTAHNNLGNALKRKGELAESKKHFELAVNLRPDFVYAQNNLATALHAEGDLQGAEARLRKALELQPNYAEAHTNLGNTLVDLGRWQEGLAECRKCLELQPDYALGHWNLGLMLLRLGDFENGWREYEWRWRVRTLINPRFDFPQPIWHGEDLGGKRILLTAEQGLGDAIQFIRYAPMVARQGGRVLVYCLPELIRLMRTVEGVEQAVGWDKPPPECDVQCALLSLPDAFKTTLATIPGGVPYLSADKTLSRKWGERMEGMGGRKVGLAWAGRPTHYNDRRRSIPLSMLGPLAEVEGTRFFSLQKGEAAAQVADAGLPMTDWTDELNDMAETAALMENLDLVITSDTSVAHLAGAMGKAVWVLLPFVPDFRWMLERSDSPWYPTMRLFRQKRLDDWRGPIDEATAALRGA